MMDTVKYYSAMAAGAISACLINISISYAQPAFEGEIGRTLAESKPDFAESHHAKPNSPNIIYIVMDDTGFADLGSYGSEIHTANLDRLAEQGLRYNNFYTRSVCSPTRAALLTGRNSHSIGMGNLTNIINGFPGKRGEITPAAATIAELLRSGGYTTYALGKWHVAPLRKSYLPGQISQWPLQRGFDRYYGFLGGMTDHYHPTLVRDNTPIDPPLGTDYHLSTDLVNNAISYLKEQEAVDPHTPFFLYLAFGATHAPHHAPPSFVEKYLSVYTAGWNVIREQRLARQKELGIVPENTALAPMDPTVPEWEQLSKQQRSIYARFQAAYAGFLEHTDFEIGRLLSFLKQIDKFDNTLIIVVSDNGASREGEDHGTSNLTLAVAAGMQEPEDVLLQRLDEIGGDRSYGNYPRGWAAVSNTPFADYKHSVRLGGLRAPMIISWPDGIKIGGEIHKQFVDVIDITPTALDVAGLQVPRQYGGAPQMPLEGESIEPSFRDVGVKSSRDTQYFELWGRRALWSDNWFAVSTHKPGEDFEKDRWELFNLAEDFSAVNDLSEEHPQQLAEMQQRWWRQAEQFNVLPLDDRSIGHPDFVHGEAEEAQQKVFRYYPSAGDMHYSNQPYGVAPETTNKSFAVEAFINRRQAGSEGVLVAMGDRFGGYVLYVRDQRLHFEFNDFGRRTQLVSRQKIPAGKVQLEYRYEKTGDFEGNMQLLINGKRVAHAPISTTPTITLTWAGMDIGRDIGSPVSDAYLDQGEFSYPVREFDKLIVRVGESMRD